MTYDIDLSGRPFRAKGSVTVIACFVSSILRHKVTPTVSSYRAQITVVASEEGLGIANRLSTIRPASSVRRRGRALTTRDGEDRAVHTGRDRVVGGPAKRTINAPREKDLITGSVLKHTMLLPNPAPSHPLNAPRTKVQSIAAGDEIFRATHAFDFAGYRRNVFEPTHHTVC